MDAFQSSWLWWPDWMNFSKYIKPDVGIPKIFQYGRRFTSFLPPRAFQADDTYNLMEQSYHSSSRPFMWQWKLPAWEVSSTCLTSSVRERVQAEADCHLRISRQRKWVRISSEVKGLTWACGWIRFGAVQGPELCLRPESEAGANETSFITSLQLAGFIWRIKDAVPNVH